MAAALAIPMLSQPTELDTQKKVHPYGDGKPDGLVCVHQDSKKQ
jgi:hypothetical protein